MSGVGVYNLNNITYTNEQYESNTSTNNVVEKTDDLNSEYEGNETSNNDLYSSNSWQFFKDEDILKKEVNKLKLFLFNEINNSEIEFDCMTKIEKFFVENYNNEMFLAINDLYVENVTNNDLIIKILRLLMLIPNNRINNGAKIIAYASLNNSNKLIQQQAIQALGMWADSSSINLLKSINSNDKWFNIYVQKVIKGIEEENGK